MDNKWSFFVTFSILFKLSSTQMFCGQVYLKFYSGHLHIFKVLSISWFTWDWETEVLNNCGFCKPSVRHQGPWVSIKVRESESQNNDGLLWNSGSLRRNWKQKEYHVFMYDCICHVCSYIWLYIVTWLEWLYIWLYIVIGWKKNHKFRWKVECFTIMKKTFRRLKEV